MSQRNPSAVRGRGSHHNASPSHVSPFRGYCPGVKENENLPTRLELADGTAPMNARTT